MHKTLNLFIVNTLALLLLVAAPAIGQPDVTQAVRDAENLKTGNTLDVLTSFFQLALGDLGGKDKSFAFKSTLFGIKTRADSSLLEGERFRRQRPWRNLQLEVALHTGNTFRPIGISGGITYAIVNERDRQRADYRQTDFTPAYRDYTEAARKAYSAYSDEIYEPYGKANAIWKADSVALAVARRNHSGDTVALLQTTEGHKRDRDIAKIEKDRKDEEAIAAQKKYNSTGDDEDLPEAMKPYYRTENVAEKWKAAKGKYDEAVANWAARSLLTVGITGRTDSATSHFREGNLEMVYLKGLGGRSVEADVRTGIRMVDTLTPDKNYRYSFNFVGGANIILLKSKVGKKSLFELKPSVEFRSILSKQYPDENNYFSFNMDIRLRVTDAIWIPFIVKYDVENQNFLGFLNVSANFDALSGLFAKNNSQ